MSKKELALFFVVFVLISHIALPLLNRSEDIFLLSPWNMFSNPITHATDISWDKGYTYLFRDHRAKAKELGIRLHPLFFLVNKRDVEAIREIYKEKLKQLCQCDNLDLIVLKNNYYSHILKKERGEMIRMERL